MQEKLICLKSCGPWSVRQLRDRLRALADDLQRIDDALARLADPGFSDQGFDVAGELKTAAECVRKDLLADAVETLRAAANADERTLRQAWEERRQWIRSRPRGKPSRF